MSTLSTGLLRFSVICANLKKTLGSSSLLYSSENEVGFFQESAQRSIRRRLCEKFGVHLFFNLTEVSFLISIDSRELTLNFASLDLFTILRYYKDKNLLIDITIKICKHILCWNNVWFN